MIASLELLGVLVGVMTLLPEEASGSEMLGSVTLTCGTDNQGNMYLVDKLLTTKYPLGVVLMELSSQLGRRGAALQADWIPRLQNEEADALTNGDFRHFSPELRVDVDLEHLNFHVMRELFEAGDDYLAQLEALKLKGKLATSSTITAASGKKKRKPKEQTLRERDPW